MFSCGSSKIVHFWLNQTKPLNSILHIEYSKDNQMICHILRQVSKLEFLLSNWPMQAVACPTKVQFHNSSRKLLTTSIDISKGICFKTTWILNDALFQSQNYCCTLRSVLSCSTCSYFQAARLAMDISIHGRRTLFHFFISETSRDIKNMF